MLLCGLGELNLQECPPQEPSKTKCSPSPSPSAIVTETGGSETTMTLFLTREQTSTDWRAEYRSGASSSETFQGHSAPVLNRAVESWGVF